MELLTLNPGLTQKRFCNPVLIAAGNVSESIYCCCGLSHLQSFDSNTMSFPMALPAFPTHPILSTTNSPPLLWAKTAVSELFLQWYRMLGPVKYSPRFLSPSWSVAHDCWAVGILRCLMKVSALDHDCTFPLGHQRTENWPDKTCIRFVER